MSNTTAHPIKITSQNFESEIAESDIPVLLDFWAPWCGPCQAIGPVLEELASDWAGQVKVAKLNVDEEPELAGAFQVRGIPTVMGLNGTEIVDVQVGFAGKAALDELFRKLADSKPAS
jgi:thioredoxin 1